MEEQIDAILSLHDSEPFKAGVLCERIISQNFHLFFDAMINKIDKFFNQTSKIKQNYDRSEYGTLKKVISILDKQLTKIIRNLQDHNEEKTQQVWFIISSILKNPNLNFKALKIMIPSITSFLSICNQEEMKYIFHKYDSDSENQNPDAQIVLTYALLECQISNQTLCKIGSKIIANFSKKFIPCLDHLIKSLQDIQDQKTAIKMVCTIVKRWKIYLQLFLKIFQIMYQQENTFNGMILIFKSKFFLIMIKALMGIDEYLHLKSKFEEPNSMLLLLQSNYQKVNMDINLLKGEILKNFVIFSMQELSENTNLDVFNDFIQYIEDNLIPKAIFDLCELGKTNLEDKQNQILLHETRPLIESIFKFLMRLIRIDHFSDSVIQAINNTVTEKQFLFFGCLCNIQKFEKQNFMNNKSLIQYQQFCGYESRSQYFVTNFMKKITKLLNLDQNYCLNLVSKVATYLMDLSMSLNTISASMELSEEIQDKIQSQNLSLYLHILQQITASDSLKLSHNSNLFEVIQLGIIDFEKITTTMKVHFLSICLNLSHLWSLKDFSDTIQKMMGKIKEYLAQQTEEIKLLLEFCFSALIKLSNQDIQSSKSQKKNFPLVFQFYQCLLKYFKASSMNQNHEICSILMELVLNDTWNCNRLAFDVNFMILDLCYQKIYDLKIYMEENQLPKEEIAEFLPKQEFVVLIRSCILTLQTTFDSEDLDMQIKISKMREIIVEIFSFLTNLVNVLQVNIVSELCSTIQVVTSIHLEENVSPDLCLIIKIDQILIQTLMGFLQNVDEIRTSYMESICKIIISIKEKISKDFLHGVFRKINQYLQNISISNFDQFLLSEILHFMNLIFLYEIHKSIDFNELKQISMRILQITEKTAKFPNSQSTRQSQKFVKNVSDFTKIQIKLLQFKFFLLSADLDQPQHLKFLDFEQKEINFLNLANQFKQLRKKMSLEELTFTVLGVENCIKETNQSVHKEFVLKLGLDFIAIKHKKLQISSYLKQFQPIRRVKDMILDLKNRPQINLTVENMLSIEELLGQLEALQLYTPTPRKIIKLKKKDCLESMKKYSQNHDEDVII